MKKLVLVVLTTLVLLALLALSSCTESTQRSIKSIKSDWTGGLNRKVEVYDYNGELIKSWEGKFDVKETDRNSIYFDNDDKRVIISGGIIINEEIK